MQLITIVNAQPALQQLVLQPLPIRQAWELLQLVERCNIHLRFYGEQLQRLGPEPDPEKLTELQTLELPDFDAMVRIPISLGDDLRLSAADIKSLAPFLEFKEG